MLAYGVVIGAGVEVPPFTRLTLSNAANNDDDFGDEDDEGDDESWGDDNEEGSSVGNAGGADTPAGSGGGGADADADTEWDVDLVGPDGKGRVWNITDKQDEDESEDEEEFNSDVLSAVVGGDPWKGRSMGATEHQGE